MFSVVALFFLSPFFGLPLELDTSSMASRTDRHVLVADASIATVPTPAESPRLVERTLETDMEVRGALEAPLDEPRGATPADVAASADDGGAEPPVDVAGQLARRARLARAHRRLGMATWGAMTAAVVTGTLQYANLYGFFAPSSETRCGRGNAFFGRDACLGTPVLHATSAGLTAALYYTTFSISFAMPDPIGLDRGDSDSARALRQHKRMRWVHFSGMALQGVLGALVANPQWMGLDRSNDYRTLQSLATVHLLAGYATYGILTYTGARMAF